MRIYSLGMIILSSFVSLICLVMILSSTISFFKPEIEIKGSDYKRHINFEFFKQKELTNFTDKKMNEDLLKLSEKEWVERWELSKKLNIQEIIHSNKTSLVSTGITLVSFLIILGIHFKLYRKTKPVTLIL